LLILESSFEDVLLYLSMLTPKIETKLRWFSFGSWHGWNVWNFIQICVGVWSRTMRKKPGKKSFFLGVT